MSPADHDNMEIMPYDNLARIDTSNDWSDIESLGDHSTLLLSEKCRNIEVIPLTPDVDRHSFCTSDDVASPHTVDSLTAPRSSIESVDDSLASLVISVTNLDLEGAQTDGWEATLHESKADDVTGSIPLKPSASVNRSVEFNMRHRRPMILTHHNNTHTNSTLKPMIHPRPTVSLFDKENDYLTLSRNNQIPLPETSGHRRVSFNSLPSLNDLEHGVETSLAPRTDMAPTTTTTKKAKQHRKKWSHHRPKVLNATTGFR